MNSEQRYKFMITMLLTFLMAATLCTSLLCVDMNAAIISNHDKKIGIIVDEQLKQSKRRLS